MVHSKNIRHLVRIYRAGKRAYKDDLLIALMSTTEWESLVQREREERDKKIENWGMSLGWVTESIN